MEKKSLCYTLNGDKKRKGIPREGNDDTKSDDTRRTWLQRVKVS